MRVLLVEDHTPLADAIRDALVRAGFAVDRAACAEATRACRAAALHDLALLDLGLPDDDGLALLAEWRGSPLPVIVLTARDALEDRIAGLDGGADDYIVKPVEMRELIARCRAVLRRPGGRLATVLRCGPLTLDTALRVVEVEGRAVALGRRELGVLEQLMARKGRVVARRVLEEAVYALDDDVSPNALDAAVSRLRRGLEAEGCALPLHTVRGVGWMLADTEAG